MDKLETENRELKSQLNSIKWNEPFKQMMQEDHTWNMTALGFAAGFIGGIVYTLFLVLL
jgi:hypothetical protein